MDSQSFPNDKYPVNSKKEIQDVLFINGGHKVANGQKNGDLHIQDLDRYCDELKSLDDRRSYTCGLWSFKPNWLQKFANKKAFLAIFCLTSVLQGMYYTYFVSVLTTIEKLYQIQSKTTGIIMSATEIGQIGGALLLTYYGGQGHRPKWIACGMIVFAVASILCSTPHFLFADVTENKYHVKNSSSANLLELKSKLCNSKHLHNITESNVHLNNTYLSNSSVTVFNSLVTLSLIETEYNEGSTSSSNEVSVTKNELNSNNKCLASNKAGKLAHTVLTIFFVSLLLIGIGATTVYTLGIPYIDDNVATSESPLYFGITIGVRIFGPVFGFLLGSFCTSVYVNFPFESPGISNNDPQWIGAWWLGVFIVGAALIITSFPMMAFPRKLPHIHHEVTIYANGSANGNVYNKTSNPYASKKTAERPSLRDFPTAMRRLLRNDILLCRTASSVLHILPIAGLYTFLPKYLESQFQLTATTANMISGMAGILVMGIGIFASGSFMRKFKPNAQFVARWIAAAALAYAIGMFILMWLGCPLNSYVGLNADGNNMKNEQMSCNVTCECRSGEFAPICTSDGVTFLSPCLAGCTTIKGIPSEQYYYGECYCLGPNVTATNGFCPLKCDNLIWYIIIFSVFVLIHSTSEVGSMLLTLRCVDPQDKAMALGLISFAIGLFGNVPCPIIYGAVVDSACLFWENHCGELGACRVYDPAKFRMVFHGVTAVIMMVAFCVDIAVCIKAKSIHFNEEGEENDDREETIPMNNVQCTQFETSV